MDLLTSEAPRVTCHKILDTFLWQFNGNVSTFSPCRSTYVGLSVCQRNKLFTLTGLLKTPWVTQTFSIVRSPFFLTFNSCGVLWSYEATTPYDNGNTDFPPYSDTLGTWEKCHCNQIVTVTTGSLVTNQSFGTCQKCHCKRGVTVNSVTVSGEICTKMLARGR